MTKKSFFQFAKFGFVGISNTILSYMLEMYMFYVIFLNSSINYSTKVFVTSIVSLIISVANSYYWNNKYVFITGNKKLKDHMFSYFKSLISYSFTGLILSPYLKIVFGVRFGFEYWFSSVAVLVISVPINFFINKYWAFR